MSPPHLYWSSSVFVVACTVQLGTFVPSGFAASWNGRWCMVVCQPVMGFALWWIIPCWVCVGSVVLHPATWAGEWLTCQSQELRLWFSVLAFASLYGALTFSSVKCHQNESCFQKWCVTEYVGCKYLFICKNILFMQMCLCGAQKPEQWHSALLGWEEHHVLACQLDHAGGQGKKHLNNIDIRMIYCVEIKGQNVLLGWSRLLTVKDLDLQAVRKKQSKSEWRTEEATLWITAA